MPKVERVPNSRLLRITSSAGEGVPSMSVNRKEPHTMPTKTAAATILELLAARETPVTMDEILKLTELKPATVERVLRKMTATGKIVNGNMGWVAVAAVDVPVEADEPAIEEPVPTELRKAKSASGSIAQKITTFFEDGRIGGSFTPHEITKAIGGGHSTGAVWAACLGMAKRGTIVKVNDKPVRYALASS